MPPSPSMEIDDEVKKVVAGMGEQDFTKVTRFFDLLRVRGHEFERLSRGKHAHALKNSRHANLKELRVKSGRAAWRFAYFIDNKQTIHILCGGDKRGVSEALFYKRLIAKADRKIDALKQRGL